MELTETRSVCRACLTEEGKFQSVFVTESNCGVSLHISEMMSACATIQVTVGDGLPEQICTYCAGETVKMYLFKLKCEKSDMVLRARLEKVPECYKSHILNEGEAETIQPLVKPEIKPDNENNAQNEPLIEDFDSFEYKSDDDEEMSDKNEEIKIQLCEEDLTLKQKNKTKNFECDICQKRFSRDDLLTRHKIAHAMKMDEQKMECEDSNQVNCSSISPVMIKSEEFMFSCAECDVLFIQKEDLDNHISCLHKKKETEMSCEVCAKSFTKITHLNRHMKIHSSIKQIKCPLCNKGFMREDQLTHHMNSHSGAKPHVCDICFKGFNQISNLKDHMRTHNGEKPFLCSTCGKGFNQLGNLRQHTIRHSGIKAHLCSTCGNGFASKGELSAHLRKHTGARPFVCSICNHGFTTSSSLTKHKRIHSGEKPYECDVCKMKFSRSGILARHKRTHTGEKPYVCKFCSKAFSQSNDLTSHLRIHTGEKPYICDECGQAFRQSSALKTHKKTHMDKSTFIDTKPVLVHSGFLATF